VVDWPHETCAIAHRIAFGSFGFGELDAVGVDDGDREIVKRVDSTFFVEGVECGGGFLLVVEIIVDMDQVGAGDIGVFWLRGCAFDNDVDRGLRLGGYAFVADGHCC
jgi:hypothetical protein